MFSDTFRVVVVTLLLASTLAAPQFADDPEDAAREDAAPEDAALAWSEEATTKRLNLEDPTSWSASTEVLDENHAWYRRRRAVEEEVAKDDLEAAETVVFIPAHLRKKKKLAHRECRRRLQEFTTWKRQTGNHHAAIRNSCNHYCCYPVLLDA